MKSLGEATGTRRGKAELKLREAIVSGHFRPGERLVEQQLCEFTGVSRSVLRECLAQLETKGLVKSELFRGFSVAQLSIRNITELFELRVVLEGAAAELFTERASEAELVALAGAMDAVANSYSVAEPAGMLAAKDHYFATLIEGARNSELERSLEHARGRIDLLRKQLLSNRKRRHESLTEMRELTSALLQRDSIAAREASRRHLERARATLLEIVGGARFDNDCTTRVGAGRLHLLDIDK